MTRIMPLTGSLLLSTTLAIAPVQAAGNPGLERPEARGEALVMTLNQYLGADLTPLLTASAATFNAAVLQVLRQVEANRFPARARRQAEEIARWQPDLVGLQEVAHYECRELPPTPGACAEPSIVGASAHLLGIGRKPAHSPR